MISKNEAERVRANYTNKLVDMLSAYVETHIDSLIETPGTRICVYIDHLAEAFMSIHASDFPLYAGPVSMDILSEVRSHISTKYETEGGWQLKKLSGGMRTPRGSVRFNEVQFELV